MSRMRPGEWVAAAGAVALLVLMFFDWFGREGGTGSLTGWGALGWFIDLLVAILILGGLALSYMTIKRASPAWPVGASVLTWTAGGLIFLVLLVRVTITQPGTDELTSVALPAYLGLVAALLIPVGGFLSLRDERLDTPEARAYVPPPPRSAPGT